MDTFFVRENDDDADADDIASRRKTSGARGWTCRGAVEKRRAVRPAAQSTVQKAGRGSAAGRYTSRRVVPRHRPHRTRPARTPSLADEPIAVVTDQPERDEKPTADYFYPTEKRKVRRGTSTTQRPVKRPRSDAHRGSARDTPAKAERNVDLSPPGAEARVGVGAQSAAGDCYPLNSTLLSLRASYKRRARPSSRGVAAGRSREDVTSRRSSVARGRVARSPEVDARRHHPHRRANSDDGDDSSDSLTEGPYRYHSDSGDSDSLV